MEEAGPDLEDSKFRDMMVYMDEALKRKKERKEISERQESEFREHCSEMSSVVDSNKSWIISSV